MLRALIWDVDGTIAETERDAHRPAFNAAFAALGLPWRWDVQRYGELLAVAGGFERLLADIATRADAPADAAARSDLARRLHAAKNRAYVAALSAANGPGIPARPGVRRLVQACAEADVKLAVATTTGRANVEALFPGLFGREWQRLFEVVVCAEDAPAKKPDPLAYTLALQRLGLSPDEAMAVEDSPNGLTAARAAGLATLVTRSVYFAGDVFDGAAAVVDDLDAPLRLGESDFERVDLPLLRWLHAQSLGAASPD